MLIMPTVPANGIDIAYEMIGESMGSTVVLMRGVGSQLVHWPRELLDGLVHMGLQVVIFDNRDCGHTTNFAASETASMGAVMAALASGQTLPPVYRLTDMALDVIGLLDALEIRQAHFLGMSLGGYVGQILAAEYSERLHSFIQLMSSPCLPMPQKMQPRVIDAMMAPPKGPDFASAEDHALAVARASTGRGYPIDEMRFRDNFRSAGARGVWPGAESRQMLAAMSIGDRATYCRRIAVPALVVHGTEDPMVPLDEGRHTAELIAGAEFVPIAGMGHELTPGLAIALLPILQSFIERLGKHALLVSDGSEPNLFSV